MQRTLLSASRGSYLSSRVLSTLFTCKSCRVRPGFSFSHQARPLATLPNFRLFRALLKHDPYSLAVIEKSVPEKPVEDKSVEDKSVEDKSVEASNPTGFTYRHLVCDVARAKDNLQKATEGGPNALRGQRVAILADNSYHFVVTLLSILASEAIAVPLNPNFPDSELKYALGNSEAGILLAGERYMDRAQKLNTDALHSCFMLREVKPGVIPTEAPELEVLKPSGGRRGGMMLYTSGTTSRPKGVFIPQSALEAQAASLVEAWKYTPNDRLLHVLPLHHIHGTVNAIIAPLFAGSSIEFRYPFFSNFVWERLAEPFLPGNNGKASKITFLTAVPTMYSMLLSQFPQESPTVQEAAKKAISRENLRLNISGSAALPTPIKQAWHELSGGNDLLERYGMTEVGMALSCGLDFADRIDGSVGWPLPSVEVRLVDIDTNEVIQHGEELDSNGQPRAGEIQLRGPTIFREYWKKRGATREAFVDSDGEKRRWFKTGDIAIRRLVDGAGKGTSGEWARGPMYFIQGRQSVDIIKVGGEKVSALQVERELLSIHQVTEAAVVGLPSSKFGQIVAAVLVLDKEASKEAPKEASKDVSEEAPKVRSGQFPRNESSKTWGTLEGILNLRKLLSYRLAKHKLPQQVKIIDGPIPTNAMGKVDKKALARQFFGV